MRLLTITLIASACFFTSILFAQSGLADVANIKRKWQDISYANLSPAAKLDIYLPNVGDEQLNPMLKGLNHGYAIVSMNYRMSGKALFPANINDVKAAIPWVKANAAKYKFSPKRIALWGRSAVGNLAALAGTSGDVKELEDMSMGNANQSTRVMAVVDWVGPNFFING